jgi:hypothetical protein
MYYYAFLYEYKIGTSDYPPKLIFLTHIEHKFCDPKFKPENKYMIDQIYDIVIKGLIRDNDGKLHYGRDEEIKDIFGVKKTFYQYVDKFDEIHKKIHVTNSDICLLNELINNTVDVPIKTIPMNTMYVNDYILPIVLEYFKKQIGTYSK